MARRAVCIQLSVDEGQHLQKLVRAHSTPQNVVLRARIILRCGEADYPRNDHVAQELGCDCDTVSKWRRRFFHKRLEGLRDLPRSGAPRAFSP